MDEIFSRSELLFGEEAIRILKSSTVAVFGVGGVGGYTVEALARSGVGRLIIVDNDVVSLSNINRQIIALQSTVGQKKVEVMKKRLLDINPEIEVVSRDEFFLPETSGSFDFSEYDCVVDAIDTVSGKIEIIMKAKAAGVPVISAMGAGNKTDPTAFYVTDIYKTDSCPLARVMRRELRKRGVEKLKVVCSSEKPITPGEPKEQLGKRQVPGSLAFVPSVAGLIIASEAIKELLQNNKNSEPH